MKTLIVGAGVAGMTLAALMRRRGERPILIERESKEKFNTSGYMLGLLPLGGRVLNMLDLRETYLDQSCSMEEYNIYTRKGKLIRSYSLRPIIENYGPYRGISREELIGILQSALGDLPIRYDTTVERIEQRQEGAEVIFSDQSSDVFDLVVVADGLHSQTRKTILKENEYAYRETGWGGWVTWIKGSSSANETYDEYWGAASFLGFYPIKDRVGAFLGGPIKEIKKVGLPSIVDALRRQIRYKTDRIEAGLKAFEQAEDPYFWDFHDCRSKYWYKGNIVLLGDAATGFLPTAGVGASMAMDSAAALNDELSRATPDHLDYALKLYTNRQKRKVEIAQSNSRDLGKWGMVNSPLGASLRDGMLRFYSLEMLIKDFKKIMEGF